MLQAALSRSVLPLFYTLAAHSWPGFLLLPGENAHCACSSLCLCLQTVFLNTVSLRVFVLCLNHPCPVPSQLLSLSSNATSQDSSPHRLLKYPVSCILLSTCLPHFLSFYEMVLFICLPVHCLVFPCLFPILTKAGCYTYWPLTYPESLRHIMSLINTY